MLSAITMTTTILKVVVQHGNQVKREKGKQMVKTYWTKKQNIQLLNDCKTYNIPLTVEEIKRVLNVLDLNYGIERSLEEDGGCVFLLISDEEKEHSKIMKKYFIDKEDCQFKDILVENKGEQWISELYISATEYSITIVYKRGEKRKKCLNDI